MPFMMQLFSNISSGQKHEMKNQELLYDCKKKKKKMGKTSKSNGK
jgi:hypothetical protein